MILLTGGWSPSVCWPRPRRYPPRRSGGGREGDFSFGFTGEQTDGNGLVYLRARHYAPSLGIFPSLDPFEGMVERPMSLNGYSWVEGNVVNFTDRSGFFSCDAEGANWSDLPSACSQLDTAYQRARNVGVSDVSSTAENGIVNFGLLKSYIQNNFGFAIVGYSPTIPEGITDCNVTQTLIGVGGAPAKLSLVRTTSALLHIAAYFNRLGINLDMMRSKLGSSSTLQLVADTKVVQDNGSIVGEFTGFVPIDTDGFNIFLGSRIPMYAIVHEVGHLFDKRFNTRPSILLNDLRLRATNGLPRYTIPAGDFDASDPIASGAGANLGLGGRANDDANAREVWADMFMTAVLDNQGIQSTGEITGLIAWTPTGTQANRWVGEFKRAYSLIAIRRLMLDSSSFATATATNEEKIAFLTQISNLINPTLPGIGEIY